MTRRKAVPTLRAGTKPGLRKPARRYTGAEFVERLAQLNRSDSYPVDARGRRLNP